jgi:hypothetical protein
MLFKQIEYHVTPNKDIIELINVNSNDISGLNLNFSNIIIEVNGTNLTSSEFYIKNIITGDIYILIKNALKVNEIIVNYDNSIPKYTIIDNQIGNTTLFEKNLYFNDYWNEIPSLPFDSNSNTIKFWINLSKSVIPIQTILASEGYNIINYNNYFGISRGMNDLYGFDYSEYFDKFVWVTIHLINGDLDSCKIFVNNEEKTLEHQMNIISDNSRSHLTNTSKLFIGNFFNDNTDYQFKGSLYKFMIIPNLIEDSLYQYDYNIKDDILYFPFDNTNNDLFDISPPTIQNLSDGSIYDFKTSSGNKTDIFELDKECFEINNTFLEEIKRLHFKEKTIYPFKKSLFTPHEINKFHFESMKNNNGLNSYINNRIKKRDESNKVNSYIRHIQGHYDISDLNNNFLLYISPLFKTRGSIKNMNVLIKQTINVDKYQTLQNNFDMLVRNVKADESNLLDSFPYSVRYNKYGTSEHGYYKRMVVPYNIYGWELLNENIIKNNQKIIFDSLDEKYKKTILINELKITDNESDYYNYGLKTDHILVSPWDATLTTTNKLSEHHIQYKLRFNFDSNKTYWFMGEFKPIDYYKDSGYYCIDIPHMLNSKSLIMQVTEQNNRKIFVNAIEHINDNSIRIKLLEPPELLKVLIFKDII